MINQVQTLPDPLFEFYDAALALYALVMKRRADNLQSQKENRAPVTRDAAEPTNRI